MAIIGAGPAGLFAAWELVEKGVKKIALIDKGKPIEKRSREEVLFGIGGAGLYSDGKLILSPVYGKTDLTPFVSLEEGQRIVDKIEAIFRQLGVKEKAYPRDQEKAEMIKTACQKQGVNLLLVRQLHLGSDASPQYITRLVKKLTEAGVELLTETEVAHFQKNQKGVIEKAITTEGKEVRADYFLVAPGRSGNLWLTKEIKRLGLEIEYQPIEIGVRIEVAKEILADICRILYEPALFFYSQTYDDQLRTFCVVPVGFVVKEVYKNFVCVNGHAYKNKGSTNANFALLVKVQLSEPTTNTIAYGESICKLANTIGGGKPILQRYADFKRRRRSTWSRLKKAHIQPTLTDVTPGDISMALPHRIVVNLEEGIEKLDRIIPGIASPSTLLYAPEVKFFSARVKTNAEMQTKIKNLFVAGDGAGISGNIVGAAATGIIAARKIANLL